MYDDENKQPLDGVEILNVHTGVTFYTDSTGLFSIEAKNGELIEFALLGYGVERVRIGTQVAKFYNIGMRTEAITLEEVKIYDMGRGKWGKDSTRNAETYKRALEHYRLEGLDILQHPFDAMSKKNRQIWAFQRHYDFFEKEKYIDYVFNEKIVKELTELGTDSVNDYLRRYRPQYEMIRRLSLYDFYDYIQKTVTDYRRSGVYRKEED